VPGEKVTYYKFHDVVDFRANSACGTAAGCAPGTTVESSEAFNPHELVHAYLRPTGYPPTLLLEGAAIALSCASWRRQRPVIPWRQAFDIRESSPRVHELYDAAGWLAAYLLATRPAAAFVALYRDAGAEQAAGEFAASFARAYGEPLDDVWDEMIAAARPPAFCPWECGRPQAPLDGVTPVASDAACGVPPTHALTLAQPGELVARLTGVSNFSLGVCGAGSVPPAVFYATDRATAHVDYVLSAGDYFITGPIGDATLTLAPHPPGTFVTSGCAASAAAPPWLGQTGDVAVMVPRGMWQIDLAWPAPVEVLLSTRPSSLPSLAAICPACGVTDGACVSPTTTAAPIQGLRTLRIDADPVAGGPELVAASLIAR
jgi:hypothetical protein